MYLPIGTLSYGFAGHAAAQAYGSSAGIAVGATAGICGCLALPTAAALVRFGAFSSRYGTSGAVEKMKETYCPSAAQGHGNNYQAPDDERSGLLASGPGGESMG